MPITKKAKKERKEPKPLTDQQQRLMEKTSAMAARLLKFKPATLEKLADHVLTHGTDHEDGASVDALTETLFREAKSSRELWKE